VVFDGNYRPRLWTSTTETRDWRDRAIAVCTIGLPTLEDEQLLDPAASAAGVADAWRAAGAGEVVVKLGADGCLAEGRVIAPPRRLSPVDTSGAGDAFNAGYVHARAAGKGSAQAALAGHRLAGWVVLRPGAIPDRDDEPVYAA
jgi:2-dehydro-3-deoxygluconokinase